MPLDPELSALLRDLEARGIKSPALITPAEARAQRRLAALLMTRGAQPEAVGAVRDEVIPEQGLRLRIYSPSSGSPPFPLIVYFHGGGWVVGDLDTHDAQTRMLCNRTGSLVIAVDYRLAPEAPFPAAIDDAYTATCWAVEHAVGLGGDPGKVAVAGDSSGGNLAASVALLARDKGSPSLIAQGLIYPALDPTMRCSSISAYAEGYDLSADDLRWFYRQYLPNPAMYDDPRAAPFASASLARLPHAVIAVAEFDPLRDESITFAECLRSAGVCVVLRYYEGLTHNFFSMALAAQRARDAVDDFCARLRSMLSCR